MPDCVGEKTVKISIRMMAFEKVSHPPNIVATPNME